MKLSPIQAIKFAAIAVHAEELLSPAGHDFDRHALQGLLNDADVRAVLDDPANTVYLPLKEDAMTARSSSQGSP